MALTLKINKTTTLPTTLAPHSVYLVAPTSKPNYVEMYVTNADASSVKRIINSDDIQAMIDASLANITGGLKIVDTIYARDGLAKTAGMYVLVKNARSALTGTVDITNGSTIVTGTSTLFTSELRVGYFLKIGTETFTVASIASDTSLTLNSAVTQATATGLTAYTGDPTVNSGAASYVWDDTALVWVKLTEYESMDLSLTWDAIIGKPTSTPAAIDAAVANSHTHANMTQLGLIGDDAGDFTYNGLPPRARLEQAGW